MITQFEIENFRSIEGATVDLGRITVLTGANNSGKTSIMYALTTMRNIYYNPNVTADVYLTVNNINLGGFKEVVYRKDENRMIGLKLTTITKKNQSGYEYIQFNNDKMNIELSNNQFDESLSVAIPYPANKYTVLKYNKNGEPMIEWNGFRTVRNNLEKKYTVSFRYKLLIATDSLGSTRIFTKPYYNPVVAVNLQTEDELATLLSQDRDLESRVARYLRKITGKLHLSVRHIPRVASFQLQIEDIENPQAPLTDLVNEGLGIHHLVTILIKSLRKDTKVLCMDEPELHLHPSLIHKLVEALVEIAETDDKQFIMATHSEHFITALLECVAKKKLAPELAVVHYVYKKDGNTHVERQEVNAKGQLKGGMRTFYEAELSQIEALLGDSE